MLWLSAIFLVSFSGLTVPDDTVQKPKYDSLYIEDYSKNFTVWLNTYSKSNLISIVDDAGSKVLEYKPNESVSFGPGFGWKWIGLDLSFISLSRNDNWKYGKTNKFDIQSHFYLRKYMIDVHVQAYNGFYMSSLKGTKEDVVEDDEIYKRSDIWQIAIGGAFYYHSNSEQCSFKSSFSQTQIQKKSKGSWVIGAFYNFFGTFGDSLLLPSVVVNEFDSTARYHGALSSSIGVIGGYTHTFVYRKKWFVTLSLMPGLGLQSYKYALQGDTAVREDRSNLSSRFQSRFAFGYNVPRFYAGFSAVSDNFDFRNSSPSYVKHNFGVVRVFFGYRFGIRRGEGG
jgi:hypothetical protein